MSNKTVKILGYGFGATPAEITVTTNGNVVYSGTVPTLDQPVPTLPNLNLVNEPVELMSFEVDQSFTGIIPMTCNINSGTVIFADVIANYYPIPNPAYSEADIQTIQSGDGPAILALYEAKANPPLSQAEIDVLVANDDPAAVNAILLSHQLTITIPGGVNDYGQCDTLDDPRESPTIDGVPQSTDRVPPYTGCWWWVVKENSVFAYDLDIAPTPIVYY